VKANIEKLQSLSPKTDVERVLLNRAIQESESIERSRLLMFEQLGSSIAWPFLTVLMFWVCVLFLGFRSVRAPQRDRHLGAVGGRTLGRRCDFSYPGVE
jgi:hypothetical protein